MYVDLSMPVSEDTVVFPGDAKPVFEQAGTLAKDGFVDHVIHINNHLGTHIDAPDHMLENIKMLSDYPVNRFICDAICIDARDHKTLTLDLLNSVDIASGQAILFYTGRGDNYKDQTYATDYPPIDIKLATKLADMKVSLVGVDMISFDHAAPFPIHKALLSKDVLLIENLVNLGSVVGKRFKLYALPVNLVLHAAPARVVAQIN